MVWLAIGGIVVLVVVVLMVLSLPADEPPTTDAQDKPYQWGDELHEFSYRHPWDDEI
jgi:hypothetical protein